MFIFIDYIFLDENNYDRKIKGELNSSSDIFMIIG